MPLSLDQLRVVKDDLTRFLAADDWPEISAQAKRAVVELAQVPLDGSELLRSLNEEDVELARLVLAVKEKVDSARSIAWDFGHRITRVGHLPMAHVGTGDMLVCLRLSGEDVTFEIAQDLEDTLWLGRVVVETVKDCMGTMGQTLNAETARNAIGSQFAENLERLEKATAEIRQLHAALQSSLAKG